MFEISAPVPLGDAMLDDDHAQLYRLARSLLGAPLDLAAHMLDELRIEARGHFGREDAALRRLGGNNASCHLDEHAAVLKSLDEVHAILCDPRTTPEAAERMMASLALTLLNWLPEHVREMDAGLAAVRGQARFGGVPVRLAQRAAGRSNPDSAAIRRS